MEQKRKERKLLEKLITEKTIRTEKRKGKCVKKREQEICLKPL